MRSSATRNGPGEWADINAPDRRSLVGSIRRMSISLTTKALWQVLGHVLPDGRTETRTADLFSGVGFWARPKSSDRAEAIVLFPGGAGHPVVVATRNEDARKSIEAAIAGGLAEGETVVYSSGALIHIKANGTVEIRSNGVATVQPTILADTYRTAEDVMLTALSAAFTAAAAAFTALAAAVPGSSAAACTAAATACTAAATAIATFQASAATYKTVVAKVQ